MAEPSRRAILNMIAGAVTLPLLGPRAIYAAEPSAEPLFAACVKQPDGAYAVAILDDAGTIRRLHPLPDRGHDIAFDPVRRRCIAFARRPGTFAVVFDLAGESEPKILSSAPGRHFYGHGVFSADGSLLYATENDFEAGRGVVGIYAAEADFRRLGEVPTGGVGPHELVWLPDGRTLAIANGGLDTHPDFGRVDLNAADMAPSLTLMDASSHRLLASQVLDKSLSRLSIRHLAVDRRGAVWFGGQYEGDPAEHPPLVGRLTPGAGVDLFSLPPEIRPRTRNYIGSVAASADGDAVAFSAPRGNLVFALDAASGRYLGDAAFRDGCGLAPAARASGLVVTAGTGRVARLETADGLALKPVAAEPVAFDNHLARLA
ncbi:DUF1513 domain-containing protein [Chthonobacter rhizosphaerae]|uniref:DUF1513 domain-containing protein n=1 Tax=Chthonobacter rhizosphaerae TaxID=2735553 RepID=UPI0015EED0E7|nr:DUF1513 domain-containing protein [Chthonobacter rhizosphaerae]